MDHKFQFLLLGVPEMVWQTRPFTLARRQARALLYRLADDLQPVTRDQLIFLLWPDTSEATARRNLTRLLSYTRQALPRPDLLLADKTAVALNPDLVRSDTVQFAELGAATDGAGWENAAALYRGHFLDGFTLADSAEFDQWLSQAQRQYERTYLDVLRKQVAAKADGGDYAAAIHYAQQYLTSDDLAEEMHRHLISLYTANGDRSAALRQYEQCAIVLERELGVSPLPETRAAYEVARDGTQPPPPELLPKPEWTTLPGLDLPLIGREEAWQALSEAYRRYQNGGVIFISGEAGVGKSRLMQEFATAQSGLVLTGNSHATGQAWPYQPLVQALRLALPLRDRWRRTLPIWLAEVSRLLPELRAQIPDLPPPVEVAPQQAQAHLFEALTQVFDSLATDSPLLLCLDDVHWADEATVGWLQYTTERLVDSSICILGTYRSHQAGRLADWRRALNRAGLAVPVLLDGLSEAAVAELLYQAGADQATAQPLASRIHAATGGNAFFVLETIRELLESGQRFDHLADLPLSQTVRDTVLHRTARLTPLAQQIVAVAAVLSPHLTVEALVETSGRNELETVDGLDELLAHQLLQADGHAFRFQHHLARQAIYEEISPWRQWLLHRRAAEGLEQVYQTELAAAYDTISGQIAAHYEQSGSLGKAIAYYLQAATAAQRVYAITEAYDYTVKGLALLEKVADKSDYASQELDLSLLLGATLIDTEQLTNPQVETAFKRAAELGEQLDEPLKQANALRGLWYFHMEHARLRLARSLAGQLLDLAQELNNRGFLLEAHWALGMAFLFTGRLIEARRQFEQAEAHCLSDDFEPVLVYGQPADLGCLAYLTVTLSLLGYPDQALRKIQAVTTLAQQSSHPVYLSLSLVHTTALNHTCGDSAATLAMAEELLEIFGQHRVPYPLLIGNLYRGWALYSRGQRDQGLAHVDQAVTILRQIPAAPAITLFLSIAADVYSQAGQIEKASAILDRARIIVEATDMHFYEPELHRLQGELLRQQGESAATVEANFQRAVQVARQQQAKWLELRAVMSLARWWQSQGREGEARQQLAEIYDWFTEGFDTIHLKEAKALLEELS